MGYNCSVAALAGIGFEDLAQLGITMTGRTTTGDEALSEEQPYAAARDGQLVFACGDPRLVESVEAVAAELGGRMAGVVFGSTADFYLLHLRDGDRARELLVHEGQTVESSGDAWPEEAALDEEQFTEDGMFAVFRRVTGIGVDDAWMNQEFHELRWEFPGDEPAAYEAEDAPVDVDDSRYVAISPVRTSYRVTGVALAVGIAFEVLLGVLVLTTDATFGRPTSHLIFVGLAALTLFEDRMSVWQTMWMAVVAAVMSALMVSIAQDSDHVALLVTFAGYLVALAGIFVWHGTRLITLKRALQV